MSAKTQEILYNVTGQTVTWDCPEGQPSSVTSMKIYAMATGDDGTAETALGTPSIEAVMGAAGTADQTTFDAASGDGQTDARVCNVTSTVGIVKGQRYLATNAAKEIDWVEVDAITSGVSVRSVAPLKNAYASADTLESVRVKATVDATWVADSNNISDDLDPNPGYRCRIVYVVAGVTYAHQFGVDLVRYRGTHAVTPDDMRRFRPAWENLLPTWDRESGGQAIIDTAYEEIRWDLHRAGKPDEMVRNQQAIDALVMRRAWLSLLAAGRDEVAREHARVDYQAFLDGLFRVSAKVSEATDTSGAGYAAYTRSIMEK